VVVVAPATAVAGAATTTEAHEGHTLYCAAHLPAKWLAVGRFSLFSGTATHARSGKNIAERAGLYALPQPGADHA
jgi:hypothetical protein